MKIYFVPPQYQEESATMEQIEKALRRKMSGRDGSGIYLEEGYAIASVARNLRFAKNSRYYTIEIGMSGLTETDLRNQEDNSNE